MAALAGSSQPYVARLESGEENATADTVERFVVALDGRFEVSIAPKEMHLPRWQQWWDLADAGLASTMPYGMVGMMCGTDGKHKAVAAGWTDITTPNAIRALSSASVSTAQILESHGKENR